MEIGQFSRKKKIQNNDSEDNSKSWKRIEAKIEKMQEMFAKGLELKYKQTEMNNILYCA